MAANLTRWTVSRISFPITTAHCHGSSLYFKLLYGWATSSMPRPVKYPSWGGLCIYAVRPRDDVLIAAVRIAAGCKAVVEGASRKRAHGRCSSEPVFFSAGLLAALACCQC